MAKKILNPLDLRTELQAVGSAGSLGQVLVSNGAGAAPSWTTPVGGGGIVTGGTGDHTIDQGANGYVGLAGDRRNGTAAIIGSDPSNTANLSMQYAWVAPCDGTLLYLIVNLDDAPGTGNSIGFTVRKNGSSTSLSTTISNSATSNSDIANTVSVVRGDYLAIYITPSAALTNTINYAGWTCLFVPTSGGGGISIPQGFAISSLRI